MTFKEGIPGWVAAGYDLDTSNALPDCKTHTVNANELAEMLDSVMVVDIRNNQEVSSMGAFPNSLHIPFEELEQRYSEIPKEKKLVVVDYSGVEYACAAAFLKQKGHQETLGLQGGVKDWIKQGNDLLK